MVVDDAKFDRYVTGVPRQYEAVVFFTAAAATYKCTSCRYERVFVFVVRVCVCVCVCVCVSHYSFCRLPLWPPSSTTIM